MNIQSKYNYFECIQDNVLSGNRDSVVTREMLTMRDFMKVRAREIEI